jgi:hypothetical protein
MFAGFILMELGISYIKYNGVEVSLPTESFAMPNMEARTVAKIIVEEVIVMFGVPCFIHSDQVCQFESNLFEEMCVLLGIENTRTIPYPRHFIHQI